MNRNFMNCEMFSNCKFSAVKLLMKNKMLLELLGAENEKTDRRKKNDHKKKDRRKKTKRKKKKKESQKSLQCAHVYDHSEIESITHLIHR